MYLQEYSWSATAKWGENVIWSLVLGRWASEVVSSEFPIISSGPLCSHQFRCLHLHESQRFIYCSIHCNILCALKIRPIFPGSQCNTLLAKGKGSTCFYFLAGLYGNCVFFHPMSVNIVLNHTVFTLAWTLFLIYEAHLFSCILPGKLGYHNLIQQIFQTSGLSFAPSPSCYEGA